MSSPTRREPIVRLTGTGLVITKRLMRRSRQVVDDDGDLVPGRVDARLTDAGLRPVLQRRVRGQRPDHGELAALQTAGDGLDDELPIRQSAA